MLKRFPVLVVGTLGIIIVAELISRIDLVYKMIIQVDKLGDRELFNSYISKGYSRYTGIYSYFWGPTTRTDYSLSTIRDRSHKKDNILLLLGKF